MIAALYVIKCINFPVCEIVTAPSPDDVFQPSDEQIECFTDYITNNPTDSDVVALAACPSEEAQMANPLLVCETEACRTPLARIFNDKCGYDLGFSEYSS